MTRVYLVRHATHGLVGKVLAGRMPGVPLSPEGEAQARGLAAHFAGSDVATILSSPIERARQTAGPVAAALVLDVAVDEALNEIDCGTWTGVAFEALGGDPAWRDWNSERGRSTMPGGESIGAVEARSMALVRRLAAQAGPPAVLVTHSDVIKVVMLSLLGACLDRHDRLEIDPASITTLDLWPGGGRIVRSNHAVPA